MQLLGKTAGLTVRKKIEREKEEEGLRLEEWSVRVSCLREDQSCQDTGPKSGVVSS